MPMPQVPEQLLVRALSIASFALLFTPMTMYVCRSPGNNTLSRKWVKITAALCGVLILCSMLMVAGGLGTISPTKFAAGIMVPALQLAVFVLAYATFVRRMGRPPEALMPSMPQPVIDVLMHAFVVFVLMFGSIAAFAKLIRL